MVGAGLIGKRHIEAIGRTHTAELAAIVDPMPQAAEIAFALNVPFFATIGQMIKRTEIDGAIIATPNQLHVENGLECINARIPILVEKPLADKSGPAAELVAKAETLNTPILVGHHRRYNPLIKAAKQKIQSGGLGDIIAVQASCWLYKPDDYFNVKWRTEEGAGPIFINLIHDVDLLRHLVGEISSVQAILSNKARGHGVEDTAAIIVQFENGAVGTLTVSDTIVAPWSWELTAKENPAYHPTGQNCYWIGGREGSLEIPGGKSWFQQGEKSWWQPLLNDSLSFEPKDPLDLQIAHFCDVIGKGVEPLVSGAEGLKTLLVIEAIRYSASIRKSVSMAAFGEQSSDHLNNAT